MLPNDSLDPIFLATVQATEEAVVNAMVAAETMKGIDDHEVIALPHDRLREVLKKYNRLAKCTLKTKLWHSDRSRSARDGAAEERFLLASASDSCGDGRLARPPSEARLQVADDPHLGAVAAFGWRSTSALR